MTEQFKLITNAQESKIFKRNVTTIKIKCSNNFPRPYSVELPTQAWNKAKISPYTPLKTALRKRENSLYKWRILIGRISWRIPPGADLSVSLSMIRSFYVIWRGVLWATRSLRGKVPRVWFHVFVSFIKDFLWLLTSTTFKACLQGLRVTLVLGVP